MRRPPVPRARLVGVGAVAELAQLGEVGDVVEHLVDGVDVGPQAHLPDPGVDELDVSLEDVQSPRRGGVTALGVAIVDGTGDAISLRASVFTNVLFPAPDSPTNATVRPATAARTASMPSPVDAEITNTSTPGAALAATASASVVSLNRSVLVSTMSGVAPASQTWITMRWMRPVFTRRSRPHTMPTTSTLAAMTCAPPPVGLRR